MGFAAAAALTFCTPSTGAAAQPAAVLDAFLAGWNREDVAAVSKTLSTDAWVAFGGDELEPAPVAMSGINGRVLLPFTVISKSGTGSTMTAHLERARVQLREIGPDGKPSIVGPAISRVLARFEIQHGCIMRVELAEEGTR